MPAPPPAKGDGSGSDAAIDGLLLPFHCNRKGSGSGSSSTLKNLEVAAGTLGGTGALTLAGTFDWTGGSLGGGDITASSTFTINGGVFSGSGTFTGTLTNSGQVSPGLLPGTLTITGNYTQTSAGS